jgi:hypothetical protein
MRSNGGWADRVCRYLLARGTYPSESGSCQCHSCQLKAKPTLSTCNHKFHYVNLSANPRNSQREPFPYQKSKIKNPPQRYMRRCNGVSHQKETNFPISFYTSLSRYCSTYVCKFYIAPKTHTPACTTQQTTPNLTSFYSFTMAMETTCHRNSASVPNPTFLGIPMHTHMALVSMQYISSIYIYNVPSMSILRNRYWFICR